MEFISCDFIGKLPRTDKGNCYILTFIDHFTKFIKLYAVPNQSAITTCDKYLDFVCTFGVPERLLSDKGTQFMSELFKNLCTRFGTTKLNTTALNPKCNGASEKINLNIKKALSIFAQNTAQWDEYVDYYALIYNSSMHSAINDKPSFLHLGYETSLPIDILNERRPVENPSYADFVARKTYQLQFAYEKVRDSLIAAAENQEKYQHKFAKDRNFYVGQLVYMYQPDADRNNLTLKRRSYVGPFRIIKQDNKVNFTIIDTMNPKASPLKVNSHRLIPYTQRKAELDLLTRIVRDDPFQGIQKQNTPASNLNRPHAVFDELEDSDIITPLTFLPSVVRSSNSPIINEQQLAENTDSFSPTSSDTEIYEPTMQQNEETHVTPRAYSYGLRPLAHRNLGNRNLQRDFDVTNNDKNETAPQVISFLDKVANALTF